MDLQLTMPLAQVRQAHVALVGGKAATLGMLCHAGFPIPAGLCITTTAFRLALGKRQRQIQRVLRKADFSIPTTAQASAQAIADLLVDLRLPPLLEEALVTALLEWTTRRIPLAIRSSATGEDGKIASYAGQYATTLAAHDLDAVKQAILVGWRSFFSANALVARATHGALKPLTGMALLIQPLLAAECAGVAFSLDPVQQRGDRLVINAAWGLGVGVVDGSVATDTAWLKRADFTVDRQQIVEKLDRVALDVSGLLTTLAVPLAQQRSACLPPAWLERVAQFTIAAETALGVATEIEWAVADGQLWLLQARPMTGLGADCAEVTRFPVSWQHDEDPQVLWKLVQKEGEPEVLFPLNLDDVQDVAATRQEGCRLLGVERNEQLKICNGRLYIRPIPMPWTEADCRARHSAMLDLRLRLQEQGLTTWDHWGPEIVKATERLRAFDRNMADGPALADHLEDVLAVRRRHYPLHPAMDFTPPQSYFAAFAALSGLAGEEGKAVANRLLDSEETPFTQLIDDLYALALLARHEPTVVALLVQSPDDLIAQLQALPQAASMLAGLQQLLTRYGERTGYGWGSEVTLQMPTWEERPALVLALVTAYLDPGVAAPKLMRQRARQRRETEVAAFCDQCPDAAVVAEFRRQLAYARKVSAVVELHNHYLDQMYTGQLRQALVAAARWLLQQGSLSTVDEIYWLYFAEIAKLLRNPNSFDLTANIAAQQLDYQDWQTLSAPPILGLPKSDLPERPAWGDDVTRDADNDQPEHESGLSNRLSGLGASHGCHRGIARLANDPFALPKISTGDILVAENVGPMWTPLFPTLGGLVLESGSVGQHAAATAREYGVPVAIRVKDARRHIVDGSWISVDGTSGIVEL